ncbi:tyrosine-type recombinase/integrase [Methylobacterium sp. P31]
MVAAYRDERLNSVSGETVRRELTVLRHCIEIGRKEWGAPFAGNPVRQITLPSPSKVRGQRLPEGAEASLMAALAKTRVWYLRPLIMLALETGMRRGGLLALEWSNIDMNARLADLTTSKNGYDRSAPMTPRAIDVVSKINRTRTHRITRKNQRSKIVVGAITQTIWPGKGQDTFYEA